MQTQQYNTNKKLIIIMHLKSIQKLFSWWTYWRRSHCRSKCRFGCSHISSWIHNWWSCCRFNRRRSSVRYWTGQWRKYVRMPPIIRSFRFGFVWFCSITSDPWGGCSWCNRRRSIRRLWMLEWMILFLLLILKIILC